VNIFAMLIGYEEIFEDLLVAQCSGGLAFWQLHEGVDVNTSHTVVLFMIRQILQAHLHSKSGHLLRIPQAFFGRQLLE